MNISFKIKCKLCGNVADNKFYVMPCEVKTRDGLVHSNNKFKIVCKACGKIYYLRLSILDT